MIRKDLAETVTRLVDENCLCVLLRGLRLYWFFDDWNGCLIKCWLAFLK